MADAITSRPPAPAKLRILATADELFYTEGIHTVGVDRIIAEAKVTKATFYKHFHSKETLIVGYVHGRDQKVREFFAAQETADYDPARVLQIAIDAIGAEATRPGFNGCPFINAAAQFTDPSHPARVAVSEHRDWYMGHFEQLLRELGHPRPGDAADDIMLARDGALGGGHVGDPVAANAALHRSAARIFAEA